MTDRYTVSPQDLEGKADIVSYMLDLFKRMGDGETSLRIGQTAIEDGNLVVRNGDIIVSETDDTIVLRLVHGERPEIRMWPLGETDAYRVAMFAFDFNPSGDPDQAYQVGVETEPGGVADGGKVFLSRTSAVLSHHPEASGDEESYLWLNYGFDEIANYRGRWFNQIQVDSHQGLYMGAFTATSGFSTWTHTYFTPFATTIVPVFTVGVAGTTIQWGIESYSASAFTMRFSTTTGNKLVTFWNFRI